MPVCLWQHYPWATPGICQVILEQAAPLRIFDCDVLVMGGDAMSCAAICTRELGASVAVLERAPQEFALGTIAIPEISV